MIPAHIVDIRIANTSIERTEVLYVQVQYILHNSPPYIDK